MDIENKSISFRLDKKTNIKFINDVKQSGLSVGTYAGKTIAAWTNYYKPSLENECVIFPVQVIKLLFVHIKEEDHNVVSDLIVNYWLESMKVIIQEPTFQDYVDSLIIWCKYSNVKFKQFQNEEIKHVFQHNWNLNYSKIICLVFEKIFGSVGYNLENIECTESILSYTVVKRT